MTESLLKHTVMAAALLFLLSLSGDVSGAEPRPNIVWIVVDDMSCHFGYEGESLVTTPNVDKLAKEGVVFSQAYATAPVCSTFRSAMITGMYQTAIGAHHHRSSRGELKISLPEGVRTIPELFREAGYYTSITDAGGEKNGKQDYNFDYNPDDLYDGIDWKERAEGQPFFAQFQLRGGKIRNVGNWIGEARAEMDPATLVSVDEVELPPYYPDHPVIRDDWAAYLDSVSYTDIEVGRILNDLRENGGLENTIVFFLTDHGISHARGKQFLYEEGLKIPFLVWSPKHFTTPVVRDELIAHIDLGATSLELAGIEIPEKMQGRPLFGEKAEPRDYVVSARDRCDETVDRIRSIRMGDFKYIRNFHPQRPYLQPCAYKDHKPFMPVLRELYTAGKLDDAQSLIMAEARPEEELYDLSEDPWEIHNLAADPDQLERLSDFRALLGRWGMDSNDRGRFPESEAMFDSDMAAYASSRLKKKDPGYFDEVKQNIALMKKWRAEGK
ncbi:MAG: sulfatase [Verrucomicrobiales bacterium]|nr:sulfatase [Verrucomicrobiales bacterium]